MVLALAGLLQPTRRAIVAVWTIAAGTAFASAGELHFSSLGVGLMLGSVVCESLRLAGMQFVVGSAKLSLPDALLLLSPPALASLWGIVAMLEVPRMLATRSFTRVAAHPCAFAAAASLGAVVNALALALVARSDALTYNLVGQAKNVALVAGAACLLPGNAVSGQEVAGYAVALAGFVAYAWPDEADGGVPARRLSRGGHQGGRPDEAPLLPAIGAALPQQAGAANADGV